MAARINLDLDTLRTFVVAHDFGGLSQAAEQLGRTPSAISLQMKRLQDDLGIPLFRKRGRGLILTEAGETALAYACRILALNDQLLDTMQGASLAGQIRLGCPQDFAPVLPSVLSQFAAFYPRMQIEVLIEGNAALADAVEKSRIDIAAIIGHEDRSAARVIGELDLEWIASSDFELRKGEPVPLAVFGPQCAFRRRAAEQLELAKIQYRVAASSPSLDGLWGALLGNLGITVRTGLNLREGLVSARSLYGLPPLGSMSVTLHRNAHCNGAAADRMTLLLTEALGFLLSAKRPTKGFQRRTGEAAAARKA
jgi:DNA-binding transcriptional LysR family regulator